MFACCQLNTYACLRNVDSLRASICIWSILYVSRLFAYYGLNMCLNLLVVDSMSVYAWWTPCVFFMQWTPLIGENSGLCASFCMLDFMRVVH